MKKKIIPNLIYAVCAVIFEITMVMTDVWYENRNLPEKEGTSVVIFGDSVIAYAQDDTSVASFLARETGLDVKDLSFGGTTMAYTAEDSTLASDRNFLSMASIALAYSAGDFALPRNHDTKAPATEYFEERERELEALDLSKTDVVIIEHCLNDYHCAVPIGDLNSDSIYTYLGALRTVVDKIRDINPDIRIILVSPTEKWMPDGVNASEYDYGGGVLDDYVRAQREAAEELGVEYIYLYDLYDTAGYDYEGNPISGTEYTVDGTHPNYYGRELIAKAIADYL